MCVKGDSRTFSTVLFLPEVVTKDCAITMDENSFNFDGTHPIAL